MLDILQGQYYSKHLLHPLWNRVLASMMMLLYFWRTHPLSIYMDWFMYRGILLCTVILFMYRGILNNNPLIEEIMPLRISI